MTSVLGLFKSEVALITTIAVIVISSFYTIYRGNCKKVATFIGGSIPFMLQELDTLQRGDGGLIGHGIASYGGAGFFPSLVRLSGRVVGFFEKLWSLGLRFGLWATFFTLFAAPIALMFIMGSEAASKMLMMFLCLFAVVPIVTTTLAQWLLIVVNRALGYTLGNENDARCSEYLFDACVTAFMAGNMASVSV
jgi:hypothetical protein